MDVKELFEKINCFAESLGLVSKAEGTTKGNAVIRKNIGSEAFISGQEEAFFGFIRPEESYSGGYSDLSLVIFPQKEKGACIVALGVGSLGFNNDYPLAQLPGLRRAYLRLLADDEKSFCKTDFTDITSKCAGLQETLKCDEYKNLRHQINKYETVLQAARILDPDNEKEFEILKAWLATYAYYRDWATSKKHTDKIKKAINNGVEKAPCDEIKEINGLLLKRHFVVLQGAPGTGKTYNASQIAESFDYCFFEQFHAETNYSDFVYGIRPKLNEKDLQYEAREGILYQAIKKANENKTKKCLLIIDEINRANLANVLGPVFYLFEYQTGTRPGKVKIGDLEPLDQLPPNLYVLATMNTADRSLAVVDFALRRRFAWYTLVPHEIDPGKEFIFHMELFKDFARLFDKYATDEELNLQPGPAYFITQAGENAVADMTERIVYELMPLMKEYFAEGLILRARDEFSNLFYEKTKKHLYR